MKVLKFALVGLGSAIVQFSTLFYLVNIFPIGDEYAIAVAYLFSVCFHFIVNRVFTFSVPGSLGTLEVIRYLQLVILNFFITFAIAHVGVAVLNVSPYLVTVISIMLTFFFSYIVSSKYVFVVGSARE